MRQCRWFVVLSLIAVAACHSRVQSGLIEPGADAGDPQRAAVRRAALITHDKQRNVGLSIAVSQRGRVVFSEGLGFADLEDSVRVTPRTRFTVASITKAFTGVALLKAVEAGLIDLDAPIQRYVPSFPTKPGVPITPRLLAAHLGGIRHWRAERTPELYARHFDDIDQILPLFAADSLVVAPATRYSYSSYGYNLLGAALQAATKQPYQRYVAEQIFAPLALHATQFDDVRQVIAHRARHYSYFDLTSFARLTAPVRVPDWDYSHNMAAGDILTTPEDLVRFGGALLRPGFLSAGSWRVLTTRPRIGEATSPMASGLFIGDTTTGPRRLYINGSNAGVQAGLYIFPDAELVIAIISNAWGIGSNSAEMVGDQPNDLPRRIAAVYLR
jgi:serine beta-lactamase-like protein LACTB